MHGNRLFGSIASHDWRLSRRYKVAAVEKRVKYGNNLCIFKIAAGIDESILTKLPEMMESAKNNPVTIPAIDSILLRDATWFI